MDSNLMELGPGGQLPVRFFTGSRRGQLARQFGDFLRGQAILPGALRQVVRASAHALFWGVVLWLLVHYG